MSTSSNDYLLNLLARSRTVNERLLPPDDRARADAVWRAIRESLAAESDPTRREALAGLERHPAHRQAALRDLLDDIRRRDPTFAAQLDQMALPPAAAGPVELPSVLAGLRGELMATFNLEELKDLAFILGYNPDTIPSATLQAFARGLILVCWSEGNLEQLAVEAARLRPHGDWQLDLSALPVKPPAEYDVPPVIIINAPHRSIFSNVRQVLAVLAVALGVAAIVYGVNVYNQQPRPMTGEFNIAVAGVDMVAVEDDQIYGPIISQQIASILRTELQAIDPGVMVSSDRMPHIDDDDEDAARALARKVNADMVIFGEAETFPGGNIRFTPHFYVNDIKHPNVFEINGTDFLEKAISLSRQSLEEDPPDTQEIATRAALMTQFTQALVHLAFDDLPAAGRAIEATIARLETDEQLAGLAGYEVIYLYGSHIARLDKRWDAAETLINKALALSAEPYARGYIAQANLFYDLGNHAAAYDSYLKAAALSARTADHITAKASLGLGNLALASLASIDNPACDAEEKFRVNEAITRYQAVIDAFEAAGDPDEQLASLAGLAQTYTGQVYQICGDREAAVSAYRAALTLSLPPAIADETKMLLAELEAEEG